MIPKLQLVAPDWLTHVWFVHRSGFNIGHLLRVPYGTGWQFQFNARVLVWLPPARCQHEALAHLERACDSNMTDAVGPS